MGLLDDYDKLLRGKPKTLPFGANLDPTLMAMTAGDEFDPFMKGRHIEALQLRPSKAAAISADAGWHARRAEPQRAFAPGTSRGPASVRHRRKDATGDCCSRRCAAEDQSRRDGLRPRRQVPGP